MRVVAFRRQSVLNVHLSRRVLTRDEEITCLEWDATGTKLIIGDAAGGIQIWSLKEHIVNEWSLMSTHEAFAGEKVLAAVWFHNGIKVGINMDKKDQTLPYNEKFATLKFGASVRQFGGKPADGCLAISSSGLVWSLVFLSDGTTMTGTETLGQYRSMIRAVDICYAKNGHFLVVTSDGSVESSVNCYTVNVKVTSNSSNQEKSKCSIQCQPFSSFYLNASDGNVTDSNSGVTLLKFVLKEAAEAVIVATDSASGSAIELWELRETPITIHKALASKAAPASDDASAQPKTVVWQHTSSFKNNSQIVSIATPRLSLYDVTPPPSFIVVAYGDNTIKCMLRENLQQLCSVQTYQCLTTRADGQKPFAQKSPTPRMTHVSSMQFTWSGCALVVLDASSQIFVYRLAPIIEPSSSAFSVSFAQSMLEYCLILGNDWWDIMLSLRPNIIDGIVEKLKDGFTKQSPSIQQKYFTRYYQLLAALYRCQSSGSSAVAGQCKAGDCYATIMLNAIATSLKSLLRARENQDKEGPAESLNTLIQSKVTEAQYQNVDKCLLSLENKLFFVEQQILQSLQNLNQWVADFALYLLASLPLQCHNHMRFPGVSRIYHERGRNY